MGPNELATFYPRAYSHKRTAKLQRNEQSVGGAKLTAERGHFVDDTTKPHFGIALSGGGIRSASYCLGVLQEMRRSRCYLPDGESDLLTSARYLTSVSGGGYIAGAHVMLNAGPFDGEVVRGDKRSKIQGPMLPEHPSVTMPAFVPGSPEEKYLRDRTRYLTHGWGGPLGVIWRLIAGIAWNLLILILGVAAVAIPIGWLYGAHVPALRAGCVQGCAPHVFSFPAWSYWVAGGAGIAALGVAMAWVVWYWPREGIRRALLGVSLGLIAVGLAWLLFAIGMPWLLGWIHANGSVHATNRVASAGNTTGSVAAIGGAGTGVSILTALLGTRAVRAGQAAWKHLSPSEQKTVKGYLSTRLSSLWSRLKMPLLNFIAAMVGPITVGLVALTWIYVGALYPIEAPHATFLAVLWGAGLAVLAAIWLFGDVTAWSMHPFYRERLSAAFMLKRFRALPSQWSPTAARDGDHIVDATRRPYDFQYRLSDALLYPTFGTKFVPGQGSDVRVGMSDRRVAQRAFDGPDQRSGVADRRRPQFPELVVCSAANVSKYGAAPTDSRVSSFVFSSHDVGGPLLGSVSAPEYEQAVDDMKRLSRHTTLPAAIAISGAALSPEMGRMTRAPLRFLLTMFNVRLGVWLPNPNRLSEFDIRQESLVGKIRMVPRVTYLLKEMVGKNDPEAKFIYVTDGGHYENLGLVEMLRRRVPYIWCVDASGERQDGFSTIAGAIAIAYSELGIRIDIDPMGDMAPDKTVTQTRAGDNLKPVVKQTYSVGTIHYPPQGPNDSEDSGMTGRLVIIKTGVPADAPDDVLSFYQSDTKNFPCDPTLDQLYTADRFDAYRSLGAFAASQAIAHCHEDFGEFLTRGRVHAKFIDAPIGLSLEDIRALNPDSEVLLGLAVTHDNPLESGAVAELLESLSVLHVLRYEGEKTQSIYLDSTSGRVRLAEVADGLLPPTPLTLETDAQFSVDLKTLADIAEIVTATVDLVRIAVRGIKGRKERRTAAREAVREQALQSNASEIAVAVKEQLAGDITINGDGNTITINVSVAPPG